MKPWPDVWLAMLERAEKMIAQGLAVAFYQEQYNEYFELLDRATQPKEV